MPTPQVLSKGSKSIYKVVLSSKWSARLEITGKSRVPGCYDPKRRLDHHGAAPGVDFLKGEMT